MSKIYIHCVLILFVSASCVQKAENTIRLIPNGYTGPIIIIFNQEDGSPVEYENGFRLYRIPENGVLKTQFKPNYGSQKHHFYYVDESGTRDEIQFILVQGQNQEIEGRLDGNGTVYAYLEQAIGKVENYDSETKKLINVKQPAKTFFIGDLTDLEKDYSSQIKFLHANR